MKDGLTWIELSKSNFVHNLETIRKIIGPKTLLAPCVKANAYGHGLIESAEIMSKNGADWLCVDTIDEALLLRKNKIICPILIMGYIEAKEADLLVKKEFRVFLYDLDLAKSLSQIAVRQKRNVTAHIKVDTGMSRQGVTIEDFSYFISEIKKLPRIKIDGVATHFATAGEIEMKDYYNKQNKRFKKIIEESEKILGKNIIYHCANSSALVIDNNSHLNLVRPGIIAYGYYPNAELKNFCLKKEIIFRPVLSLYTKIIQVKKINKGERISYGGTFLADKSMQIAVLPVGYYDGISRNLSNKGYVIINGKKAPIVGRVCMNIMMVDISHIEKVKPGDQAIIIGKSGGSSISADEIADLSKTINYEVITRLRESANRIVKD